mgnify:CR=1 FL=1
MRRLFSWIKSKPEFNSASYWESRYKNQGTSGAGSYGRLAQYKADVINKLAKDQNITQALEFGSGDGNQCSLFSFTKYTGVDVSWEVINRCRDRFSEVPEWLFYHISEPEVKTIQSPLVLSLDVIFHLVEDDIFDKYMHQIFRSSTQFALIYSSDSESPNSAKHVRHRKYSDWISRNRKDFRLIQSWENPFAMIKNSDPDQTSFAQFKLFSRT